MKKWLLSAAVSALLLTPGCSAGAPDPAKSSDSQGIPWSAKDYGMVPTKATCGAVTDVLLDLPEAARRDQGPLESTQSVASFSGFPDLVLLADADRQTCRAEGCKARLIVRTPFQEIDEGPIEIGPDTIFQIGPWIGAPPPTSLHIIPTGPVTVLSILTLTTRARTWVIPAQIKGESNKQNERPEYRDIYHYFTQQAPNPFELKC